MNEHNARLAVFAVVLAIVGAAYYKARTQKATATTGGVARPAMASLLVGGVLYMLSGVAPQIVIPMAGLLAADVLVAGPVGSKLTGEGTSLVSALGTTFAPPAQEEPIPHMITGTGPGDSGRFGIGG